MNNKLPPTQMDLVLIGGGHAHVHVLKMLGMPHYRQWAISYGVQVTLIARDLHTPYSAMLPGFVAGHYSYDEIHLDVVKLCRFSNTRLIHSSAKEILYNGGTNSSSGSGSGGGLIYCDDGRPPIRFDALSIDVGITPATAGMTQATVDAIIPVKPIANFCQYYQGLRASLKAKYQQANCSIATPVHRTNKHVIAVIGGGAGGVELALSMDYACRTQGLANHIQVVVVTRGNNLMEQHNRTVQSIFRRILKERKIDVYYQAEVTRVEPTLDKDSTKKRLVLSDASLPYYNKSDPILVDDVLWCTQASAATWLSEATPFATTQQGNFIQIHTTYESISHKGVFACGDCCEMIEHPRPKAGVFAVRAGPPLLENLKRYLSNQPLREHFPQRDCLGIISTGDKYAVASKGWWFALEGRYLWTVKDYIDRTWMGKYTLLPNLEDMMTQMRFQTAVPANSRKRRKLQHDVAAIKGAEVAENLFASDPMRCGGCGAKVGMTTVSRVLAAVHKRQVQRANANNLPGPLPIDHDDAAILPLPPKGGGAIVQTIDYFRSIVDDPFVFGKIVAVHALSDVHAMGAKAQSALALAVVPFAADETITESLLLHLLSGISDVLQEEGVQLVGGHTCEGLELACGLSVQGYTENPDMLLRKRGGRLGDKIVLTKPLGTGALFASDMRAQCRGEHVAQAVNCMIQSNAHASQLAMQTPGVHACTDCTGFGLMGHLLEMLMANETQISSTQQGLDSIGVELNISGMEFLKGGLEASSNGIYSSLQPQNERNRRAVINHADAAKAFPEKYALLFDPQTAGGLIFFVDPTSCDDFVSKLRETYPAAGIIGELVKYPENDDALAGGVCSIGSGAFTGQRVRIAL